MHPKAIYYNISAFPLCPTRPEHICIIPTISCLAHVDGSCRWSLVWNADLFFFAGLSSHLLDADRRQGTTVESEGLKPGAPRQNLGSISLSVNSLCLHANQIISPLYRTRTEETECFITGAIGTRTRITGTRTTTRRHDTPSPDIYASYSFCKPTISPCELYHSTFISNPKGGSRVVAIRIRTRLVFL